MRNVHERLTSLSPAAAGALLDSLSSPDDRLWPHERWPPMRFDRPLAAGARGGHGPIRYGVAAHEPGRRVELRFDPRTGLDGFHAFEVEPAPGGGTIVRHVLEARTRGQMRLLWPLAFRWLHDALVEDALDRAAAAGHGAAVTPRPLGPWVRLLRRLLRPQPGRRQALRRAADLRSRGRA